MAASLSTLSKTVPPVSFFQQCFSKSLVSGTQTLAYLGKGESHHLKAKHSLATRNIQEMEKLTPLFIQRSPNKKILSIRANGLFFSHQHSKNYCTSSIIREKYLIRFGAPVNQVRPYSCSFFTQMKQSNSWEDFSKMRWLSSLALSLLFSIGIEFYKKTSASKQKEEKEMCVEKPYDDWYSYFSP